MYSTKFNSMLAHDDQAKSCWKAGLLSRVEYTYSIIQAEERRGDWKDRMNYTFSF
jgi:hypothetical protein